MVCLSLLGGWGLFGLPAVPERPSPIRFPLPQTPSIGIYSLWGRVPAALSADDRGRFDRSAIAVFRKDLHLQMLR